MNELEAVLTAQNLKMAATMIILLAAIYSFVKEKIPADLTALLAVLGLLLTGVLTPGKHLPVSAIRRLLRLPPF